MEKIYILHFFFSDLAFISSFQHWVVLVSSDRGGAEISRPGQRTVHGTDPGLCNQDGFLAADFSMLICLVPHLLLTHQ